MQHALKESFQVFNAANYRVAIVISRFNPDITEKLLESARNKLAEYSVLNANILILRVAGAVELPLILQKLAESRKFDCLVALGAVIRGDTTHYDYVCKIASDGVLRVQLESGISIGFGVLTCENQDQALARLDVGGSSAEAALQSTKLIKDMQSA